MGWGARRTPCEQVVVDGHDDPDSPVQRDGLGEALSHIATEQGCAVRVEVHDFGGMIYADIIDPPPPPPPAPAAGPDEPEQRHDDPIGVEVAAGGFLPGEPVHIAVTISTETADDAGRLTAHLDPAHLDGGAVVVARCGVGDHDRPGASVNGTARPTNDSLANVGIVLLIAAFATLGLLRLDATLAAWVSGLPQPTGGITAAIGVLADPRNPGTAVGTPDLNPVIYWTVVAILAGLLVTAAWAVWRATRNLRGTAADPRRLTGTATTAEIARTASARSLRQRAKTLRPSLTNPRPADVGFLLGTAKGQAVWATVEDSMLLIGPPRSGKGLHIVINAILDAPGAVITTSTRPDNLTTTLRARQHIGPVAVFDPQHLAPGLPAGLRWSPVRGCENPLTAMIRATGLASSTGLGGGGVDNGGFWEGKTRTAIQALLHAAALDGRNAQTLYQWALNPTIAADAVRILQTSSSAAGGWAESLDAMIQADPRTRDSIWQGVSLAFAALADPRVIDAITPRAGDAFDPASFLQDNGTLYLLATGAGAGASAALVAAFIKTS